MRRNHSHWEETTLIGKKPFPWGRNYFRWEKRTPLGEGGQGEKQGAGMW